MGDIIVSDSAFRLERELRDVLLGLALSPDEQLRVTHPLWVACELIVEFEFSFKAFREGGDDRAASTLNKIDQIMDTMIEADFECFEPSVVERPVW